MHPIEAFKQSRRQAVEAAGAEEKARREAIVFAFWAKLRDHAGDAVIEHVTITIHSETPAVFKVSVPNHIPIYATTVSDGLKFGVTRRHQKKTFEHFGDALAFGEPYPMRKTSPRADTVSFDTSAKTEPAADGQD